MLNKLIRYFDLASMQRTSSAESASANSPPVIRQYLALLFGIVAQRFFATYQTTGSWSLGGFWGWLVAAIIIAICIFPSVYKNALDPTRPLFVQLCMIFASGMGWQSLFQTAMKATGTP